MHRAMFMLLVTLFLVGCAPQRRLGFSDQQWKAMSSARQQHVLANYKRIQQQNSLPTHVYAGPRLMVYLLKGEALMPPEFNRPYAFQIQHFQIAAGECKILSLLSVDTALSTELYVCYDGVSLQMDPSRYELDKSHGTVEFSYNPVWKRGFTYDDVTTTGYARLSHASVSIKALREETQ